MRARHVLTLVAALLCTSASAALAHCEIPCGIYGDDLRIALMEEDISTIEKSMQQIGELTGKQDALSANQLGRWITNKEEHANKVQHAVTQYFMTQRLKAPEESDKAAYAAYTTQLVLLHKMLRAAMKCKQTVDLASVEELRTLAHEFKNAYGKR